VKKKVANTSMACTKGLSMHQKKVENIVEEYKDIFFSPTGVPLNFQVKHSVNITPGSPLPNRPVYLHYLMENEEIK
jgi:hypothetical protein